MVFGTIRTTYMPAKSNELYLVTNPVWRQPEIHIHHYPDIGKDAWEVQELRLDAGEVTGFSDNHLFCDLPGGICFAITSIGRK